MAELIIILSITFISMLGSFSALNMQRCLCGYFSNSYRTQRAASTAIKTIERRLRESSPDQVQILSSGTFYPAGTGGGDIIIFPSARNRQNVFVTDSNGNPIWQYKYIYYMDTETNSLYEAKTAWNTVPDGSEESQSSIQLIVAQKSGSPVITNLYSTDTDSVPINFRWDTYQNILKISVIAGSESEMAADVHTKLVSGVRIRN